MKDSEQKLTIQEKVSQYGLYIFAFSLPLTFVPAEFAIGIAFLGWLLKPDKKIYLSHFRNIYLPILAYIIWNIIASSISPRPLHSLGALADNEWPMLIMFVMIFVIENPIVLKRMVHLWLFSASIAAMYGIWQSVTGIQFHRSGPLAPMGNYFRATGFNGFYLTYAGFMMSVFFISLSLYFYPSIRNKWRYGVTTTASFLAVIGTFARSIWLSFLVAIPVFSFVKGKKYGTMLTISFLVFIIGCLIFVPAIRERAFSMLIPSENQTRINLWKTTIAISKDFPLIGIGEDNFDYYFERYKVEGFYDTTGHPHNDYLNVLVNSGIPGLIFFILIWISILAYGFKVYRTNSKPFIKELSLGGNLAVLGFMVGGIFQNYYGTFANCWGWWLMAGFIMTSYKLSLQELSNHNKM